MATEKKGIAKMMDFIDKEAKEVTVVNEVHNDSMREESLTPLYIMIPKELKHKFDLYCVSNSTTKRVVITNYLREFLRDTGL